MCIVRNENWVALFKNIFHTDASEMLLATVDSLSTLPSQKMPRLQQHYFVVGIMLTTSCLKM